MMDPLKDIRWKQRFENLENVFRVLEKYIHQEEHSELERAGLIQLFEISFELAWKVMKDYLEAEGYVVKSPRETIKTAFQTGLITEGHIWMKALSNRNLTTHTYDEALSKKLVKEIRDDFFPVLHYLYEKLSKEQSL